MAAASRHFYLRLPEPGWRRYLSWTTVKTIIATLQGVQALHDLIWALEGHEVLFIGAIGIDSLWLTISKMGILRIFALPWLTDDFDYRLDPGNHMVRYASGEKDETEIQTVTRAPAEPTTPPGADDPLLALPSPYTSRIIRLSTLSLSNSEIAERAARPYPLASSIYRATRLAPTSSWTSWIARATYLLVVYGLTVLKYLWVLPYTCFVDLYQNSIWSVSVFNLWVFYATMQTVCVVLFNWYFFVGYNENTIIPCAGKVWYKVFTVAFFTYTFVVTVLFCLETRYTICGTATTFPKWSGIDALSCPHLEVKGP